MKSGSINERLKFGFVVFTILVSLNLWSFQLISENVYNVLEALVILIILVIVLQHHLILRRDLIFKNSVFLFILIPIVSAFGAYIFHDQSFSLTLLISRLHLLWLFYFVLHYFNFSKEKIIKLIVIVGIVWAAITIIQQFTYPVYYFFSQAENRVGIYRFMVNGQQYGAFFLFYFFYQYLIKKKTNYLLFVLIGLVSFYYYGTRQFAIAAMVCMLLAVFMVRGRAQLNAILVLLIVVPILYIYKDVLFTQYIELTTDQIKYGDDIRQLSAKFWLNEYWPNHWIAKITGNGSQHKLSSYGQELELIRIYQGFYRSDVGIIGVYNEFGVLYVFNILLINFKGLRNKYLTYDNKYLKLIFFYSVILLLTSQYYTHPIGIPFYCLIFYLVEKSFEEKKENI